MKHHRPYTLIEVLAAVAVLVLMMSFLFQFTSGAQRIWSASHAETLISDNADNILSLLSEDLDQIQLDDVESDTSDPHSNEQKERERMKMGYVIASSGDNNDIKTKYEFPSISEENMSWYCFSFFTFSTRDACEENMESKKGDLIYVMYYRDKQSLYRYQVSSKVKNLFNDNESALETARKKLKDILENASNLEEIKKGVLIAEGVEKFEVKSSTGTPSGYDTPGANFKTPANFRLEVTLKNPNQREGDKTKGKTFTQVFFVGMR